MAEGKKVCSIWGLTDYGQDCEFHSTRDEKPLDGFKHGLGI